MSETVGLRRRIGLFVLFLLGGLLVFVVDDFLKNGIRLIFEIGITLAFLLLALWLRTNEQRSKYFQVTFAFFVASLVMLLVGLLPYPGSSANPTATGYLLYQIISTLVIIIPNYPADQAFWSRHGFDLSSKREAPTRAHYRSHTVSFLRYIDIGLSRRAQICIEAFFYQRKHNL